MTAADERLRVVSGDAEGTLFEVADELVVGHARFHRNETGRLLVEAAAGQAAPVVNGRPIGGPRLLRLGDRIDIGETSLRYEEAPIAPVAAPTPTPTPAPVAAPARAAAPVAKHRERPAGGRIVLALVAVVLLAGALVGGIAIGKGGRATTTTAPVVTPTPAADADASGALGTIYIDSNKTGPNANSVLAYRYRAGGTLHPYAITEYPTGGSGSTDTADSGVLDADQHVLYSPQRHLLFAVNQGSDTVAVFHVHGDGGLTPVAGSPFGSGGTAPVSIGLSGNVVIVTNKASDGIRDLSSVAPDFATFVLHPDGSLSPTGSSFDGPLGSQPTQAQVSTDGRVVMTSEVGGPFRGFTLSANGTLTPGPDPSVRPPSSLFPPGILRAHRFGLGLAVSPTGRFLYAQLPTINAMAVYRYDDQGRLTFVTSVKDPGSKEPCWTVVSRDGTRVYTENAANNTIGVYDTSNPTAPKPIQLLKLSDAGNPWDAHLDPTGRYLFMVDPRAQLSVAPGEGQEIHVLLVGPDGRLSEPPDSTAPIPVSADTEPFGMAVAARY